MYGVDTESPCGYDVTVAWNLTRNDTEQIFYAILNVSCLYDESDTKIKILYDTVVMVII